MIEQCLKSSPAVAQCKFDLFAPRLVVKYGKGAGEMALFVKLGRGGHEQVTAPPDGLGNFDS